MLQNQLKSMYWFTIFGMIILFTAGCFEKVSQSDAASQIRVMTYNIHHGAGRDGKLDIDRIAEVIESEKPDIVGLQEVDKNFGSRSANQDQVKLLAEKLGMFYFYGPAIVGSDPENPNLYGNLILSRFPIQESKVHRLANEKGMEPRVCLESQIEINNRKFTFMVTHLNHRVNRVRIAQVGDIMNRIENIDGPIVLMGDFNCLPPGEKDGTEWKEKTMPVALIMEKFKDSFLLTQKKKESNVLDSRRIDYIFVSPDIASKVKSYRQKRDSVTDVASDHMPVIVELNL